MIILVTGSAGLVGTALQKVAKDIDVKNNLTWYFSTRKDADLTNLTETELLFSKIQPTHVIHLAAKIDHSSDNQIDNSDFLDINQLINNNVLKTAYKSSSVVKCLSVLSLCMFDTSRSLISIRDIHEGSPKRNNIGYSMSKRNLHCLGNILNSSNLTILKTHFITIIPTNVYGSHNGILADKSGILTFVNKMIGLAKDRGKSIQFQGKGSGRLQFISAFDFACILKKTILYYDLQEPLFISSTKDISFKNLCFLFADLTAFTGNIKFNGDLKEHSILIRNETINFNTNETESKKVYMDFMFTPLYVGLSIVLHL